MAIVVFRCRRRGLCFRSPVSFRGPAEAPSRPQSTRREPRTPWRRQWPEEHEEDPSSSISSITRLEVGETCYAPINLDHSPRPSVHTTPDVIRSFCLTGGCEYVIHSTENISHMQFMLRKIFENFSEVENSFRQGHRGLCIRRPLDVDVAYPLMRRSMRITAPQKE